MYGALLVVAIIIIVILAIGVYQKNCNGVCWSKKRLDGRTVVVTGGTLGIGLAVATDIARRGARVIVACPFDEEGHNAKKHIIKKSDNENVVFKQLDLASIASIRTFAADIMENENRLDILVNNAGVGVSADFLTADGMHFIMQVNYYGTVLLTLLLLPLLIKTGKEGEPSRIITTSSTLHWLGKVQINDFNRTNYWNKIRVYSNSKMCLVFFVKELARRLNGSNVIINNADPGIVCTTIYRSFDKILGTLAMILCLIMFKNVWEGAQTTLYAAVDKKAGEVSGQYFLNCRIGWTAGKTDNEESAKELWQQTVKLVKLTDQELEQCFKSL